MAATRGGSLARMKPRVPCVTGLIALSAFALAGCNGQIPRRGRSTRAWTLRCDRCPLHRARMLASTRASTREVTRGVTPGVTPALRRKAETTRALRSSMDAAASARTRRWRPAPSPRRASPARGRCAGARRPEPAVGWVPRRHGRDSVRRDGRERAADGAERARGTDRGASDRSTSTRSRSIR